MEEKTNGSTPPKPNNPFDLTAVKDSIVKVMDMNGDGQIDIEDVIILSLRVPGVHVNREHFLHKEFMKAYPPEIIDKAIASTPSAAGIDCSYIDKVANDVIQFERLQVSGISAALGAPGGIAMAATIPADIAQYYGYLLRATQELLYLYGFPEINTEEHDHVFDTETLNILVVCMGVMYGAAGANNALKAMAKGLANGISKQIMKKAITKGTIYPLIKSVSKWFSVKMTKEVLTGFIKKSIPVVGGVIGGGITFFSFKPCCDKLKASLQDTLLSNPDYKASAEVDAIVIDADDIEDGAESDTQK